MPVAALARWGALAVALLLTGPGLALALEDTEAATRQYAAAAALQNRGLFDLAAEEWTKFLAAHKADSRIDRATHYLGVCELKSGKPDLAVATFQQVLKNWPNAEVAEQAYRFLGIAQYTAARAGKPELFAPAAETLGAFLTKYPNSKDVPEAIFYRGECFYAQGKKKEAAEAYAALVQKYPDHAQAVDALYALGVSQEEQGQNDEAGKTYDAFLQKYPQSALATEVGMRRGETLFAAGQYQEAAQRFAAAAAAKDFALADHAAFRQAAALAQLKQYDLAAAVYASIPGGFPKSKYAQPSALAGGKCYYLAGDYAKARPLLEKAAQAGGDAAAEAAHWIARGLLKQKDAAGALGVVEKALPNGGGTPFGPQLLMDQADALYDLPDRRKESVGLYAALATKHPKDPLAPQAMYMAAFAALGVGDYNAATGHAAAFLAAFPQNELAMDVSYVAAEARLQLGQYAEAEKLYTQLLEKWPGDAPVWKVRRGLAVFLQKKHQETIAALAPVVAGLRDPALAAEANYLVGASHLELKQAPEGLKSLQASLAADPKWRQADETLLALAYAWSLSGKGDQAVQSVRKLIAEFPQSRVLDRAHFRLGEYLYAANDLKEAAAEYERVVEKWPESPLVPAALYGLGWARLGQKLYAEAEAALDRLVQKYPQDKLVPRARYARGMARQQLGKFEAAIDDVQALLAADPTPAERSDARYVVGLCQSGMKKPGDAAATFRKLLEDDPQYAAKDKVLYELAWALQSAGQDKDGAGTFARLAKEHPDSPLAAEALFHAGEFAYKKDDFAAAAAAYYVAAKKAGNSSLGEKATYKLGWAYFRQDDFQNASQTFKYQRAAWPRGPLAADAAFVEAECLFKQDKFQEALAAYDEVKNPSSKEFAALLLLHSAQAAAQLKQWDKSLKLARQCAAQHPDSPYAPQAMYEEAWAVENQGRPDEAIKLYEAVIAKAGNQEVAARAQFMIGELQFARKDHKEAIKSFYRVVAGYGYPKWQADAMFEAARCFEVLKMKDQAVKQYKELVDKHPTSDKAPLAKERIQALGG